MSLNYQDMTPAELAKWAAYTQQKHKAMVVRSRTDPAVFNELVLRDEASGARIENAAMHREWHRLVRDHNRLVITAGVESGKTAQLSIGRTLWEIGHDPNIRCVIVTKTANLAQKITRSIAQYITKSDALHSVFPKLKRNPDQKLPWNMTQLTVAREVTAKDATVQATGIFGNIHGGRIDWLVLDDVLDSENTRTKTPRDHLWGWVRATLMGRLTAAARVLVLGNAWHPDDLLHRLEKEPGYVGHRFPVYDTKGTLLWPERWNDARIEQARRDMGPLEFSRALLCQARADEDARFKQEWIDACVKRGEGLRCHRTSGDLFDELLEKHPEWVDEETAAENMRLLGDSTAMGPLDGIGFYTGVDLAFSKKDSADLTCIFTIAVFPNGDRRVMEIKAGRWASPETLQHIESAHARYGSIVMVENVAAQRAIIDMLTDRSAIPVVPFVHSASNRLEFAVEGLAVEMMNKKWIIPSGHEGKQRDRTVDTWLSDLYAYDPAVHLSDLTAAACFAKECAKQHAVNQEGNVRVRTISIKRN